VTTLNVQADASGALRVDKNRLSAAAGKVTIDMGNPSPLSHVIAIQGNGVDVKGAVVSKGGTSTVSADLKPGTYTFLCTVDGHAAAGMKGTLTVR
jgi:plastocyanin